MKRRVDPFLKENWNRHLWVVCGPLCFPQTFLAKVIPHPTKPSEGILWGWAIKDGNPGFRTLEKSLSTWISSEKVKGRDPRFYLDIKHALRRVRSLLTPSEGLKEAPKEKVPA